MSEDTSMANVDAQPIDIEQVHERLMTNSARLAEIKAQIEPLRAAIAADAKTIGAHYKAAVALRRSSGPRKPRAAKPAATTSEVPAATSAPRQRKPRA